TDLVDEHSFEVGAQDLVVSEAVLTIKGLGEQPPPVQLQEDRLTSPAVEVPVAELPVEDPEHGGRDQEIPQLSRELIQNVAGKELPDHPRARTQGAEHTGPFIPAPFRGRKMKRCKPC